MKKTNIFRLILMMIILALSGSAMAQASRNLHIGNKGNQIATKIKVLADGSSIIAGYDYSLTGTDVTNAQMILMRVNTAGTTIMWQEKFGVAGKNNLINDMIITFDGNIVIVGTMGRDNVYQSNRAAIMKFSWVDGHIIWQHNLIDAAGTIGGEAFSGVTELGGGAANHALIAVGSHDCRPSVVNSMICMFENATGTLIYNEVYNIDNNSSDSYIGVCTSADGMSAYIVGSYNGDNFTSGQAHMYTPGMYATGPYVAGTMVWNDYFDFTLPGLTVSYVNGKPVVTTGSLTLNDNFFTNVYLSGGKLLIYGGSYHDYTFTGGEGESITRLDAATGLYPTTWQVQSSNMTYSNVAQIFVVNSDHVINVQTPNTTWYDPLSWLSGGSPSVESVVTDIPSLSSSTITTIPVKYTSGVGPVCLNALMDITMAGTDLYMAGVTNDPARGFGGTDVYFVKTPASVPYDTPPLDCDITDTTGMDSVVMTRYLHTQSVTTFTASYLDVDTFITDYAIDTLCGKMLLPHYPCTDSSWNAVATTLTSVNVNADTTACVFQVTATGTPNSPWYMRGYSWVIGGGAPIWDPVTGPDSKPVVIPPSGSVTITVTFYATDLAGDTCTMTRTITLTCPKAPCYDTACSKFTVVPSEKTNTVTTSGFIQAPVIISTNDSCTFTACVHVCTGNTIVGYDWSIDGGTTVVVHHTGAHTDCYTFTIPAGVPVTVSVRARIVDFDYTDDPCCEADFSQRVWCGDTSNSPCVNAPFSSLTYTEITGATGNCGFTFNALVVPNPGWTIVDYEWSANAGLPTSGTSTFMWALTPGTSAVITVTVILKDQQGNICKYPMTITVDCNYSTKRHGASSTGDIGGTGEISIFPNPTSDAVTVSSTQISISNIQVIDVNGKKLVDYSYNNAKTANISLSNFPPGTYLFRVNNNTSKVVTKAK